MRDQLLIPTSILAIFCAICSHSIINAQPIETAAAAESMPTLTSFDQNGILTTQISSSTDVLVDIAIDDNGNIYGAGFFNNTDSKEEIFVVKYKSDGSLDNTFDSDGIKTFKINPFFLERAAGIDIQSDNKIVITGVTVDGSNNNDLFLVRLNSDGTFDSSFDSDGIVTEDALFGGNTDLTTKNLTIQDNGKIFTVGYQENSFSSSPTDEVVIHKFNADGTLDNSFSFDGRAIFSISSRRAEPEVIKIQSDNDIIVAGYTTDSNRDFFVEGISSSGISNFTTITQIGSSTDQVFDMDIYNDDKIVVVGNTSVSTHTDIALARYSADGSLDNTFGGGTGIVTTNFGVRDDNSFEYSGSGLGLQIVSNNKIIVSGHTDSDGGIQSGDFTVLRYNNNGTLDNTFDGDGVIVKGIADEKDNAKAMAIQDDGTVIVAGDSFSGPVGNRPIVVMQFTENQDPSATTYSATLTGSAGYRMFSLPTSGSTYSSFIAPLWTQGIATGADISSSNPNVFTWDHTSSNASSSNWQAISDLTASPSPGNGYLVYVFEDDDPNTTQIDGGFPKTLSLTGQEHSGGISPTVNSNAGGFTLLGNPYAATIDIDLITSTDINAVYVWDPTEGLSGDWVNRTIGSSPIGNLTDGLISPFQGFFIENVPSLTGTPSLTIEETDKSGSTNLRGKSITEKPLLVRLELKGEGMKNSVWLSFSESGSTNERVRGDVLELASLSDTYLQLATTKTNGTNLLDINHLPDKLSKIIEIPLMINSTNNGDYTLKAVDFNIPGGMDLYFNNLDTKESQPITPDFRYTLTLDDVKALEEQQKQSKGSLIEAPHLFKQDSEVNAAYSITIEPNVITSTDEEGLGLPTKTQLEQNFPNPFNPSTTIRFALPEAQKVRLEVYDLLGRRVSQLLDNEVRSAGNHSITFNAAGLTSGVYIYQLTTEEGTKITRKLTLIK